MRLRSILFLLLLLFGSANFGKAQTHSVSQDLLPAVYTESGVELDHTAEVDSVLSMADALSLAVTRNPTLTAVKARISASEGRYKQSRYRPNPQLSIEVEDFGRKGESGPAQTTIGIEQPFELFGKRGARRAVAEAELLSDRSAAQQTMLELYRSVVSEFTAVLGAQENVELVRQRLVLASKIEEVVGLKVTDGAVPKAELLRAQSATKLATIDLASAEATANQERLALMTLLGTSSANFLVVGSLDDWLDGALADTLNLSLDDNPALISLQAQVAARKADIALARSTGKPDVNLGAGYRRLHDDRSNSFLVWAALPLPLFNRNRGGMDEASARFDQANSELTLTRQRLTSELRQLLVTLSARRHQVTEIRDQVIPPARQAVEELDTAYRLGSQPYISVLDAQRTLFELQGNLIEALVAGAQATADIEQITGHRLNPVRR